MRALIAFGLIVTAGNVMAHEGDCPFCKLPLIQNTETADNEVVVKFGNKRIEYRCISCVIKDQARYKVDLVVYAPSEKVGEPVVLKRTLGKWSAPEKAVFLYEVTKHAECATLARAFSSKEAFEAYVAKSPKPTAKPLSLDEFI
ncbi:MAG TPA: hypothetical protein VK171_15975, partial [Fimbriimonas sp.]|nr:hypothetical protein [Fimbriimonas sp.]